MDASLRAIAFSVALWICLSTVVIVFNAVLLKSFRHPITLICWHMLVASVLISCVRLLKPGLLKTGDPDRGVPNLTLSSALRLGFPVAFVHAMSMIAGNSAYLYLNVSFIQMIKAWTAGCVYFVGCLMGTQKWSLPVAKTIATITFGLSIASYGELEFNMSGFCLQVLSIALEGLRINLLEICLKSNGYKLNPLSSLQIFAPIMLAILVPCVALFDQSALSLEEISRIGGVAFIVNAFCAFCLNLAVYLVIQTASGLLFALGGVLKDLLIIFGSAVFLGQVVTATQVFGYLIALAGLQAYGIVSKEPEIFEQSGVLPVLWHRLRALWSKATSDDGDQECGKGEELEMTEDEQLFPGPQANDAPAQSVGVAADNV